MLINFTGSGLAGAQGVSMLFFGRFKVGKLPVMSLYPLPVNL